ncbi:Sec1-like protein [Obelidium mucronatum]|nr:Sec1-like protein [Obelidium mucronatum]
MATTSLKDLVRTILESVIFDEIKKKNIPPGQSILITDEASDAILTNANCTLNELLNLEKLQLNATRTEKADTAAVYFLTPSLENADKVIEDSYKRLYSSAFFFLTHASDEFYEKTADRFPHGYVNGFVELANIEWIPLESRVFLTNTEHTLHDLYFTQSAADLNENIAFYAKEFQSALCAMNIDPIIKYHDPSDSQKSLSARFAYALKRQIEHYKVSIKEDHDEVYPAPTPYDQMGPSTVVIVDRSFDLISPLVHSLTYQSAAHDLFDLELVDQKGLGGKNIVFKLKSEDDETNEKLVVLDESSSVFNNLRHVFLSQAIEQVTAKIKELSDFVAPTNDIAALGERVFQATDHLLLKEQLARASDFLSLLLTKIKDEKNLMDVLKTEQDLATGAKSDGVALKREKAISKLKELFELLLDDDDKWRVLLLFVLTFGHINEKDFQELLQSAALSESTYPMLRGFSFFGYDPTIDSSYTLASKDAVTPGKSKFAAWKSLFGGAKQNSQATAAEEKEFIEYARHEPRLTKILTEHLTTRLNPMEFRTVRDVKLEEEERITGSRTIKRSGTPENGKSAVKPGEGVILDFKSTNFAPKWGRARPRPPADLGGDFRDNGPKTVVIVLGGLTYTEVRECYLVGIQNEREVFIGSTEMLSADSFMDVLLEFGRSSVNPLNVLEAPLPIPEKPVITLNEDATVSNFELTSQSIFSHRPATIRRRQTSSTPNLSMPYAPIDQAPPVPQIPAGVFTTKPYPGSSSANQAIQVLPQSLQQQPRVNSSASEPTQAGPTTTVPSNLPAIPTKTASIPSFTTGTYGGYEPPRRDNQQHHTYALPTSLEAQAALVEAERIRNYVPPPSGDKPIYTFIPFDQGGVNSGAGSDTAVAGLGNIASVQPKSHQPIQPPAPPPSAAASAPAVRPEPTTPAPTYMEQQKLVRQQRLLEEQKRLEQERLEKEKRAMEEEERLKQQQQRGRGIPKTNS